MNHREIEFKYSASGIPLRKFKEFCAQLKDTNELEVPSGTDHFFARKEEPECFFRHRVGFPVNQLTFKRKTVTGDSYIRREYNLNMDHETPEKFIEAFLNELGYKREFSLFKHSSVFEGEWYFLAYYICYNEDMEEVGRFIELELDERREWANDGEAWDSLLILEKICRPLGITPLGRVKQSLFEMYRPKGDAPSGV